MLDILPSQNFLIETSLQYMGIAFIYTCQTSLIGFIFKSTSTVPIADRISIQVVGVTINMLCVCSVWPAELRGCGQHGQQKQHRPTRGRGGGRRRRPVGGRGPPTTHAPAQRRGGPSRGGGGAGGGAPATHAPHLHPCSRGVQKGTYAKSLHQIFIFIHNYDLLHERFHI